MVYTQKTESNSDISNWKYILNGVPQGSVLIWKMTYLAKVLKFADDTKVFRKVTNDTDKHSLQDDLDN